MTKEPASYRIRPKLKKEIDSYLSLLKAQGHIEDYGEMLEICFPLFKRRMDIEKLTGFRKEAVLSVERAYETSWDAINRLSYEHEMEIKAVKSAAEFESERYEQQIDALLIYKMKHEESEKIIASLEKELEKAQTTIEKDRKLHYKEMKTLASSKLQLLPVENDNELAN
ncbi:MULTISPECIES: hypothetical protein [Niallia]|uniref:Uncharacterized protein n=1 Tax=Niallia taxi TaxID=2499688 RepID=A0A3S2TSK6_9BACI|nr:MULTISPECIES: hypothetical protein [Niallia]MDK8642466.1 hypothetical protein [Niallia taxi]MED4040556.1 hypothetical protein [Niallia taxi]MED4056996.1 hypothetical protein [Niallia taxi]MED4121658.1 hypothetical protein [Niallia taxi]RVT59512.1 hypothetical protein EM808_19655 [Niallia taxi]